VNTLKTIALNLLLESAASSEVAIKLIDSAISFEDGTTLLLSWDKVSSLSATLERTPTLRSASKLVAASSKVLSL
jgi:hypothetical protein